MNTSFQKILIIQTAFIGDVILATSLVESLVREFPKAKMDMLVRKGNDHLIQNNPHINEVLIWNKQDKKYRSLFQLVKKIKKSKYDLVINTQRFGATGLLTALSGAKVTSGFKKNPFSFKFSHSIEHNLSSGLHEVERNQLLIASITDEVARKPKLYPSIDDYDFVKQFQLGDYVCMAPASVWFTKQLPKQKWLELIQQYKSSNMFVYLLGGPNDVINNDYIQASAFQNNVVNLAGKLSFLESAALMASAKMNYVNDSGPLHMASAMNAPVTAFFCSTIPAFGFGPLSDNAQVIEVKATLNCRPCGIHGFKACPKKHFKCGHDIEIPVISN
ncbi:MAG: glycosyltransferase family 9 protein [Putridiphycobacter sp.]|nr:glycosyltransferase family 9 protein [Putridiphycobacter sp.]